MPLLIACAIIALCLAGPLAAATPEEGRAHVAWMKQNLPDVPEWNEWQQRTGALPPDFDALPSTNALPDPLRFLDGRPVRNARDWAARRAEIRGLFEKYVTGSFPAKPKIDRVVLLDESHGAGWVTRNVRLEFGPQSKGTLRVQVTLPEGPGPFPALIAPNLPGWGPALIRRGYASVGFAGNDFMDDAAPLKELYPDHDFAALPRRAWTVQLVLDYLETLPQVDMKRVGLFGYSRDGKMATIAAALDERIAALIAGSTGVGGVLPWRLAGEAGMGEGIQSTTMMFPTWYAPQLRFFAGRENRLPVDANSLVALIAPRAVLMEYGLNDEVSNSWALEQVYHSVKPVYEFLNKPVRLDLLRVPGFHGANDQEACLDWLDVQFGRSQRPWRNDFLHPWSFSDWQKLSGEKLDRATPPPPPAAMRPADWEQHATDLRRSIQWLLGEQPPPIPPLPPRNFPGRGPPPGPTVVAQGTSGNPGQLAPDVPAWVIARRGLKEFGWLEPEMDQVESRRIRFGYGLSGDLYYPKGTPEGKKLPTVLWLHGYSYPLGYMWVYRRDLHPILALVKAGYAVLAYDQMGFGSRQAEAASFYDRHPHWSQLGRMVEDARTAIDALEKEALADPRRLYLFGYTLGGTVALHAAALDNRVAGVVSICGFSGTNLDIDALSWERGLLPRLGLFAGHEPQIPYNNSHLLGLISPRPVLVVQPTADRLASPLEVKATVESARKFHATQAGTEGGPTLLQPDDYRRLPATTQDAVIHWMAENFTPKATP
ncbi:MAG TPA: alpha/beta fold hydrolase [Lacunisphaera sp.]|nr:alpha/beta fold hydrolase [Lacunisphaera sp.]